MRMRNKQMISKKSSIPTVQNDGHQVLYEDEICYVCGKSIPVGTYAAYVGQRTWRHFRCYPGTPKFLKSEFIKNNPQHLQKWIPAIQKEFTEFAKEKAEVVPREFHRRYLCKRRFAESTITTQLYKSKQRRSAFFEKYRFDLEQVVREREGKAVYRIHLRKRGVTYRIWKRYY